MTLKGALLRSVAISATAAVSLGVAANADAATKKHHKVVDKAAAANAAEIKMLKEEVESLKARLDAQTAAQQATAAQVEQTQSAVKATAAKVDEAASNAQAAEDKVLTIPETVNVAVGALPKPKTDAIYVKGVKLTFGGFIEAAGIYRQRNTGADIASSFTAIPFSGPGSTSSTTSGPSVGHTQELRFTARQSRVSGLAEGDPDPNTHIAGYGEFDFISAAQTANSNESNSYNLRIRNVYATVDRTDLGVSILAGQNWSLATLNSKGITPRNEVTPPQIDAQYIPGFVWARQPQFRIADHVLPDWWVAASVENPQTTFAGGATAPAAALRVVYNEAAGSGYNSANTLSINHVPDVIFKAAYEPTYADRKMHFEVFTLLRDFYEREAAGATLVAPTGTSVAYTITASTTGDANRDTWGGGVGFGASVPIIPKLLDAQLSGLFGQGIGRYGSSQLPDVTYDYLGHLKPIKESIFLAGLTLHATPTVDLYAFGGQEQEQKTAWSLVTSGTTPTGYGLGSPLYSNVACFGESATGSCTGQTRTIEQLTFGVWDKLYQGGFGQVRVGLQYSWTDRVAFLGVGGAPRGTDNMVFWSLRYYPF